MEELKKAGIRAGVNAGVNAAVAGKGFGLAARDALYTGIVSLGASFLSSQIGQMRSPLNPDGTPNEAQLGFWEHKFMHAALGGLSAAALGNDIGAGAIGASVGEIIAESYAYYCLENPDVMSDFLDKGDITKKGMIFGRLGAAFGAYLAGCDPEEADRAAAVAVENNFVHFVPAVVAFVAIEALEIAGLSLMAVGVVEGIIEVKEGYDKNGVKGALHVLREYLGAEISTCGMAGATRAAARLCGSVQKGLAALNHIPLAQREKVLQSFSNLFKVEGVPVPALSVANHVPQFPQGVKGGGSGGGHGHAPKEIPPQGPQKEYNLQDLRDRVREKFGERMAQVHHIISPTNEATMNHPLWDLSGIGKDARHNLIILPTPKGVEIGGKRAIHAGRHNKEVMLDLKGQMDKARDIGKDKNWNQQQYAEAMKRIMQAERKALKQGERALGKKNVQPGADPDFKLKVNFEGI
jgi:hypothetical protein